MEVTPDRKFGLCIREWPGATTWWCVQIRGAAEAAERLATVHAELDGRKAQEKKLAHEAGLAHKRCALLLDGSELEHRTRRAGAEAEAVSGF